MDLSGFDGVRLRVRGDGRRYKLNVKTTDTLASENVYQAAFDTMQLEEGEGWQTITLPFHRFFPVVRNRVDYKAAPLQSSSQVAVSFGFVYSRFEFNRQANPYYAPGGFTLAMEEVSLYRSQRPEIVLVSSAGAERNAKVETEEDRKKVRSILFLSFFTFSFPFFLPLFSFPPSCWCRRRVAERNAKVETEEDRKKVRVCISFPSSLPHILEHFSYSIRHLP